MGCEHALDEMSIHYGFACDESECDHYCEPCNRRIYPDAYEDEDQ